MTSLDKLKERADAAKATFEQCCSKSGRDDPLYSHYYTQMVLLAHSYEMELKEKTK